MVSCVLGRLKLKAISRVFVCCHHSYQVLFVLQNSYECGKRNVNFASCMYLTFGATIPRSPRVIDWIRGMVATMALLYQGPTIAGGFQEVTGHLWSCGEFQTIEQISPRNSSLERGDCESFLEGNVPFLPSQIAPLLFCGS